MFHFVLLAVASWFGCFAARNIYFKLNEVEERILQLENSDFKLNELEERILQLENSDFKLNEVEERILQLENSETHAEFLATGAIKSDTEIIFPTVVMNNGAGYNSATGEFTAPVSGLYYFTATLSPAQEYNYRKVQCFMKRNNVKILELFADKYGEYSVGSYPATQTMPIFLKVGDVVNVGSCSANEGIHNDRGTSFNGVLLYSKV